MQPSPQPKKRQVPNPSHPIPSAPNECRIYNNAGCICPSFAHCMMPICPMCMMISHANKKKTPTRFAKKEKKTVPDPINPHMQIHAQAEPPSKDPSNFVLTKQTVCIACYRASTASGCGVPGLDMLFISEPWLLLCARFLPEKLKWWLAGLSSRGVVSPSWLSPKRAKMPRFFGCGCGGRASSLSPTSSKPASSGTPSWGLLPGRRSCSEARGGARERRTSSERRVSRERRVSSERRASSDWRVRGSRQSGMGERAEMSCGSVSVSSCLALGGGGPARTNDLR